MATLHDEIEIRSEGALSPLSRTASASPTSKFRRIEIRIDNDDGPMDVENRRSPYFMSRQPLSSYASSREAVLRHKANSKTVEETHVIKNEGIQDMYFTEEHWSNEIKSFVTTTPPKFVQVIKAYRVLTTDKLTFVVEVMSDPPAIFEWFCNDRPVTQDRKRFIVRHGVNVTTLTVEGPEMGVYSCSARNPAGISKSYGFVKVEDPKKHKVLVTNFKEIQDTEYLVTDVKDQIEAPQKKPPKFLHQVPHLSIKPGAEAVIDVEVESSPNVKFLWYVNGKLIHEGMQNIEFYYPKPTRCLVLFKLPESGQYTVVAQNEHGVSKCSGYIEIVKDPAAQTHLHLLKSQKKSELAPQPPPGTHRGITNGATLTRQIIETTTYVQRSSSLPRGHGEEQNYDTDKHLSTSTHDLRDSTFRVSRSPDKRHQGYLPQPPAFVTQLPEEIAISPNEKLILTAEVSAVPAADIKWDINGLEIRRSKNYSVLNENNRSTLVVHPPVKQGRYKVAAVNELGKTSFQTIVHTEHTEKNVIQEKHWQQPADQQPPEFVENVTVVKTRVENEDVLDDESDDSSADTVKINDTSSEQGESRTASSLKDKTSEFPQKPLIVGHPAAEVLVPGEEPLVLEIKVLSNPEATITWYHKNFEIKPGDRVDIDLLAANHSRLTVHNPPEGLYKAVATNEHGSIIYEVHVFTEFVDDTADQGIFTRKSVEKSITPIYKLSKKGLIVQKQDLPKAPKILTRLPETHRLKENDKLVLEVEADAIPEATFQWRQNNFEVKPNQNVKIEHPGANQSRAIFFRPIEGRYEVIAKNYLGQDSASTKVIIDYDQYVPQPRQVIIAPKLEPTSPKLETPTSPQRIKSPFDEYPVFLQALPTLTVIRGGEQKMMVVVQTKEPGTFRWFANGDELFNGSGHQIFSEGYKSILIIKCKVPNNSEYAVEFTNSYGIIHSMTTVISENEPMDESMEASGPNLITVVEKVDKTKDTPMEKGSKPEKIDKTIEEASKPEKVDKTSKKPQEKVQTIETNSLKSQAKSESLSESSPNPPRFIESLSVPQLVEGQTLETHVTLAMDTPPCTFEWWLQNKPVDEKYVTSTDHQSKLVIPRVTSEMTGLLLVIAKNPVGKTESSMHFIIETNGQKSVKIIEDTMLTSPTPTSPTSTPKNLVQDEVTIQKVEEDFTETTNIQKREETYSILVKVVDALAENLVAKIIMEAVKEAAHHISTTHESEEEEEEDEEVYQSVAENLAPVFEISKETYNVAPGENVTIHTKIIGSPCDSISWYQNGVKIEEDQKGVSIITTDGHTQLVMKCVRKDQSGTYHCRAENDYGDALYTCILNISDSMSDSMTSSFITDYEPGESVQTVYSTVGVKRKEEEDITQVKLRHKQFHQIKFSVNLAEQGAGIISYGIIKTISLDRGDSLDRTPMSPIQDLTKKTTETTKLPRQKSTEERMIEVQKELEDLIPKPTEGAHDNPKKLHKQAKLDIAPEKEALWPVPEVEGFQQGIEVQEEDPRLRRAHGSNSKEKSTGLSPKEAQKPLEIITSTVVEEPTSTERPKSTTSDDLPITKLEPEPFIDTSIYAVPSSPIAAITEELPSPKPILSPKEAITFQLPSPPMSPKSPKKEPDVNAQKKAVEAMETLGFVEKKVDVTLEKKTAREESIEVVKNIDSLADEQKVTKPTKENNIQITNINVTSIGDIKINDIGVVKIEDDTRKNNKADHQLESSKEDTQQQLIHPPWRQEDQNTPKTPTLDMQKSSETPLQTKQPIPTINLIQSQEPQQSSSLLIVSPTQQEPLPYISEKEIANVEVQRPASAYDFQLTVFENNKILSDELDLIAVNIRSVGAGSPTSVQISPLEKSDAEDEGLGEETVGLVINIQQPSPNFSHDLTIVEAQPAEINQLKASDTFEREAEVIQPKYIKLLDNQTDGDATSHASSSIKNIQRMFVFEKDDQIEHVDGTILTKPDNSCVQSNIQTISEITLQKISPEKEDSTTKLVRRDEKPAEADTYVEIYRPESVFTYELTIITPQMYIGYADIVGTMVMNEMIINVVEELTKEPSQENEEIILREKAKIRTNVSYKWILSRKDGDTHKKDVWTLKRIEQVDALFPDTTAVTNIGIAYSGEEHQITEFSMLEPTHLLTQVLSEIQKSHSSSEFVTPPEEPIPGSTEKRPSTELSKSQDLISETTTSDLGQIPTFRKALENLTLKIGEPGQLKCIVTGSPIPEVTWFVDGDQIIPNDDYEIVYEDGVSILILHKVIAEDEGEYVCEAFNSIGKASTQCFVKIQDPLLAADDEPDDDDMDTTMKKLADNFILRKIKRLHKGDRSQNSPSNRDSQHSSASANFSPSDPESEKWYYVHPIVDTTESFIIYRYFDAEYLYHTIPIRSDYDSAELSTSLHESKIKFRRRSITDTPITNAEVKAIFENGYVNEPWPEHDADTMIKSAPAPASSSEPRSPPLPNKVMYKGTPIELSLTEKNDRLSISTITPEQAGRMSPLQLYIESLCDFSQMFNEMNKTVQEKKTELLKKAKKVKEEDKNMIKSAMIKSTGSNSSLRSSQPILTRSNSQCHQAKVIEITQEWVIDKEPEFGEAAALFWPSITDSIMELSKNSKHQHAKKSHDSKPPRKPSSSPEKYAPIHRVQSPALNLQKKKSVSPKRYVSDEDYNYLKKTVEQVQHDLDEARTQYKIELNDEAAKIERMIFEISEQLTQAPVSKAQAEASEEILRTRLAEMILNLPHEERYIDPAENYEALKEPINLLKEKLGKLERRLIQDEEENIKLELQQIDGLSQEAQKTEPVKKRQESLRLRKENIARMTPLITVVKDKLTSLEDVVEDKTEQDLARRSGKSTPIDNRKIIHDLLVKINDEINEIHQLCRQNKELDCLNTVIDVLSKVCTYIDSILDTLRVWKKDAYIMYDPKIGEVAYVTVDIKKEEEEEVTNTLVMFTSGSEKSCLTTNVNLLFSKSEEVLSISYAHHFHKPCLHARVGQDLWVDHVPERVFRGAETKIYQQKPPTPPGQKRGIQSQKSRTASFEERSPPRDRQEFQPRAPTPPPHRQPPPRPPPPGHKQSFDECMPKAQQSPPRPPPPKHRSLGDETWLKKPIMVIEKESDVEDSIKSPEKSSASVIVEVPFVQSPLPSPNSTHNAAMDVSVNLRRRGDHQKTDHTWPISVINMQMSQYRVDKKKPMLKKFIFFAALIVRKHDFFKEKFGIHFLIIASSFYHPFL